MKGRPLIFQTTLDTDRKSRSFTIRQTPERSTTGYAMIYLVLCFSYRAATKRPKLKLNKTSVSATKNLRDHR